MKFWHIFQAFIRSNDVDYEIQFIRNAAVNAVKFSIDHNIIMITQLEALCNGNEKVNMLTQK